MQHVATTSSILSAKTVTKLLNESTKNVWEKSKELKAMVRFLGTLSSNDPRFAEIIRDLSERMSEKLEELHYGSTDYEVDVAHIAKESGTELVTTVLQAAIDAFCLVHNSAITKRPITAATSRNFINERTGVVPTLPEAAHYGHDSYDDFVAPFEHEEGFYSNIVTEERATLLIARHTAAFKFAL